MSESHNTRLGGMKQDILDFKNEFTSSIESLKSSIYEKINLVNEQFDNIKTDIEDCHRLGKNGSTIVRFVNSDLSVLTFLEKKLTYTKVFTSLNLVFLMTPKFMLVKI